jgi:hypothetical protein
MKKAAAAADDICIPVIAILPQVGGYQTLWPFAFL